MKAYYYRLSLPLLIFGFLAIVSLACSSATQTFIPQSSASIQAEGVTTLSNDTQLPGTAVDTLTLKSTNTPAATNTHRPTNTPLPPTATRNPNLILPGTYLVGTDIKPGLFKGETGTDIFDSCYWERLKDLSGSFDSIIANANSIGQYYIEVSDDDYAIKTDCELIYLSSLPEPLRQFPTKIDPGMYLIGIDIQSGTYKGQTGADISDSCYWERLKDLSGNFDSIITNDNSIGQYYIELGNEDYAFQTACELIFLSTLPEPVSQFPTKIDPGMYLVGIDIQSGTYKGQAGTDIYDSCYWERLKDLSGDFDSITANDNSIGQFYVQVSRDDFALKTACELELVGG